jgi:hypothetical protein
MLLLAQDRGGCSGGGKRWVGPPTAGCWPGTLSAWQGSATINPRGSTCMSFVRPPPPGMDAAHRNGSINGIARSMAAEVGSAVLVLVGPAWKKWRHHAKRPPPLPAPARPAGPHEEETKNGPEEAYFVEGLRVGNN